MKQYLREQVDWPQAFPPEEYATRRAKLRKALAADDLDAIYVTMPADITYLTGYDMVWYHSRSLTGLLLRADSDDPLFIDGWPHTTLVSTTPEITDVVFYERGPVADVIALIADRVKSQGLADGRLATQRWSYAPHGDVIDSLSDCLTEAGATVSDASFLIEEIRLIKSPLEIALMRKTANIADAAMAAARDAIRPGILETEIEGILIGAMMAAGGGYPALRSMIGSGPRSGTHHAPAQARAVKAGDLVFIDFCACLQRYHINLNRTFSLGEPDPRWRDLMDRSAGCIDAIVAGIAPGDSLYKVHAIADDYIDRNGLRPYCWYNGGYVLGIAVPPDWVGVHRTHPTPDGPGDRPLAPGMIFNLENQFDVWEDWPGGSGAAYIESFLMTDSGLEVLSSLPRNLVVV
ncbi:MAG: aminopeptidase P family protein [Proteobacteria bacterium]|nr:aminopeptidase P family protein [Pseudomonadota bacterium]